MEIVIRTYDIWKGRLLIAWTWEFGSYIHDPKRKDPNEITFLGLFKIK